MDLIELTQYTPTTDQVFPEPLLIVPSCIMRPGGLLVLRYHAETRYVDEVGVLATRQILVEVEAHLERDGFRHGADGLYLNRLFNAD